MAVSVAAMGLLGTVVTAMVVLTVHSGFGRGDCGESPPFVSPKYPGQSVFVAKILYVSGESQPSDKHIPWSIAVVEHRYWGLPWWVPNFVLIGHSGLFLKKGAEYFVDGDRTMARLSSFFPYIELRCASRTATVSDAEVDLRVLRDGPPRSGVRIIGRSLRLSSDGRYRPDSGVTVKITGPEGGVSAISDRQGIYDVHGLSPGHYSVRSDSEDDTDAFYRGVYERGEGELKAGDVWGRDVFVK